MDERSAKISDLLHEAAETHHQVFRITDGADDDWASWYAQWLVTLSELPELLGGTVVRSELTYLLVRLDKDYVERRPDEPWERYYARELVRHFSPSDGPPGQSSAGSTGERCVADVGPPPVRSRAGRQPSRRPAELIAPGSGRLVPLDRQG